jgi:basic amino acid/polyamine antiporter, APA family
MTRQKIGLIPVTSLVVGNLIGSGVFLLPATLAAFGTLSLFGWMITSLGAILLALVFAQLSSKMPETGGPHTYVEGAFGKAAGFYTAWGYWILSWVSNAALVVGIASYLSSVCGPFSAWETVGIEVSAMALVTGFNLFGIQARGRLELVITSLKLLPLILVPVIGIFFVDWHNFLPFNCSGKSVPMALNAVAFITLWGFVGVETGTVPGRDVENPTKTIPRATIIGTSLAALVYMLGTFVIMGVVPHDQLVASKAPYADLANIIFGGNWGVPVAIAAIVTCLGSLNGWTLIVGRIALGAAKDGLFPPVFKRTNKAGTPVMAVIISSICAMPFVFMALSHCLLDQFNFIIDMTITLILVVYGACVIAYLKLLHAHKDSLQKWALGIAALLFVLWALWAASPKMVALSLGIVVLGVPVRLWMQRQYP